jgi:NAD(P)-dependent dehydrogenase (short-subunit alcohol dehydrogenase family)
MDFQRLLSQLSPQAAALSLALAAALAYLLLARRARIAAPSRQQAVVISGCDSGFGEGAALRLRDAGFTVFAGCLTPAGVARWRGQAHVEAFELDVTSERSVAEALADVVAPWLRQRGQKGRALFALVNNAGIGTSGLADWCSTETYRRTMDVNFHGHVAMTKAFLPELMAAAAAAAAAGAPRPRVVSVTSVAGILAAPGLSAYCASKYALEAFSDALRREKAPWRLGVAIIEPSFLATPILHNVKEKSTALWESLPALTQKNWGRDYFAATLAQGQRITAGAESPTLGIDAICDAVCEVEPAARYRAGTAGKTYLPLIAALPAAAADALIRLSAPAIVPDGMRNAK